MSFESWRKQFYPEPFTKGTWLDAAKHSLRKWRGALPENRQKHKVDWVCHEISDYSGYLPFDDQTCALCIKAEQMAGLPIHDACRKCPLKDLLGAPCDTNPLHACPSGVCYNSAHFDNSLYERSKADPAAMVIALSKVVRRLESRRGKK